jgi:hypothetical protein
MSMKLKLAVSVCFGSLILCSTAFAQVDVQGYYRKDGTYVAPYERTAPNSTRNDNYSTRGNVNPYTGVPGTKPRDENVYGTNPQPRYGQPAQSQPNPYAPPAPAYGQPKPETGSYGSPYGF